MKQIEYTMRIKFKGTDVVWNEDNGAMVPDSMTVGQHAKMTVDKYNKYKQPSQKEFVFIVARKQPIKTPIRQDDTN